MKGLDFSYYHYRTKGKAEIDLILQGRFGLIPVEIKAGGKIRGQQVQTLKDFIAAHDCPYGLMIYSGNEVYRLTENIYAIPAQCL